MQNKIPFTSYPYDKQTVQKIISIVQQNSSAYNILLQYPKCYLKQAFNLSTYLKKNFSQQNQQPNQHNKSKQFFTLFDSMKNQCCTDIIGAEHVSYDLLIHFGNACFSEPYQKNHYYLFPTINQSLQQHMKSSFTNQQFLESLQKNNIRYLLVEQDLYQYSKKFLAQHFKTKNVQIFKLPYDAQSQDEYLNFGYYATPTLNKNNNILVLMSEHPQNDNKLLSNIHLTLGSFSSNKKLFTQTPQLFVTSLQVTQIQPSNVNYSKPLMIRLAQIGELQKYETFGLLVSNAGTSFCKKTLERCQIILKQNNKKVYVFMMNNLNQVKLGNFPQIEVYVIISCYNNSCFSSKDFCRLVVTPIDLQVAFNNKSITQYNFDLSHPNALQKVQSFKNQTEQQQTVSQQFTDNQNYQIQIQKKKEIMLTNTLQTLDYYRGKQYKGLDFSEKKPVEKIKKGKIGLAQQYTPLSKDNQN